MEDDMSEQERKPDNIIKRSEWDRGRGKNENDPTFLLGPHGKCCLGSEALACGATEEQIMKRRTPFGAQEVHWPSWLKPSATGFHPDSPGALRAMKINDDTTITNEERERKLIDLAAENGEVWVFVD
jgi:hypothetical protein